MGETVLHVLTSDMQDMGNRARLLRCLEDLMQELQS